MDLKQRAVEIDARFARFIASFGGGARVEEVAGRLMENLRGGHTQIVTEAEERSALLACSAVGDGAAQRPLVLDSKGRLFLRRYYEYEQKLSGLIKARLAKNGEAPEESEPGERAVKASREARFLIVSGAPGTGKTFTARRIVEDAVRVQPEVRIALAAPTGKAAGRLDETLGNMELPHPIKATTIHRLLGIRPHVVTPRHHAGNPLPLDLLIVDEASMIDLPLMTKLLDALDLRTRLVLLGDKDQLPSVEAGNVLGDLAQAAKHGGAMEAALIVLQTNHRFSRDSMIFRASQAVRAGDYEEWEKVASKVVRSNPDPATLEACVAEELVPHFQKLGQLRDPVEALAHMGTFRVLCALRRGIWGAEFLNKAIKRVLSPSNDLAEEESALFHGLPVLITRNSPEVGLFNGDVGVVLRDMNDPDQLHAWFQDGTKGVRAVNSSRLPAWQPAYALTVHKSQGSEFQNIHIVLPTEPTQILTRELLYTAVTRAREGFSLWANPGIVKAAIGTPQMRFTALQDALESV